MNLCAHKYLYLLLFEFNDLFSKYYLNSNMYSLDLTVVNQV